jgi:hypothetical protein
MVAALEGGRALPANELARRASVAPSTASEHLARLVGGGLLAAERSGRHRYFRLASADVAHALETLAAIAPRKPVRTLSEANVASALAGARTCYDHLAGRLGVAVTEALRRRGALRQLDGVFVAGRDARAVLGGLGIDFDAVAASRRPFALSCLDWTERRPHVAGAVGAALAARAVDAGWVRRRGDSRALHVTDTGRSVLAAELGLTLDG